MKYLKTLGLLAIAVAALMAFAGTSSATITSPAGTKYNGSLTASSTNTSLYGSAKVSCAKSSISGTVNNGETSVNISSLSFSECGKDTVEVLSNGTLSIASDGTITSTGAEVTVQLHRTIIVPHINVTTHCIFKTNNTTVGTLTEGVSPAVIHMAGGPIPIVETDPPCTDFGWTGTYTITTPSSAITID